MANASYNASVEQYVNNALRTAQDLESLDSLLQNLQSQQELQRRQLSEAEEILRNATKVSIDHNETVRRKAEKFNRQQADIDKRLMVVTQSDTSDEAVKEFETLMERLRRLDIAKGYMELLDDVEKLSKEALKVVNSAPRLALPPYTRLRSVCSALKFAQPAAEGAAPHLVDRAEKLANTLRDQMVKAFGDNLRKALEKMKWPSKELDLRPELILEWTDAVDLLLELQEPELEAAAPSCSSRTSRWEPCVLLPLGVMVHPLELRFKYHFSGDRATNRLDKPEYFLSHVVDLINTHGGFFATYLQPIFDRRAGGANPNLAWAYSDAIFSYITSLFPMLRDKISTLLPKISDHPQLLSHFMHELMKFDDEIRDVWSYSPDPYSEESWKGLTWEVLIKQDWFARWLQVEKDFALARYQDIIDTPDSGEIDYDGVQPTATKPTKAAIRVNDLLETITERYRPLSSFSQKLRFLIDIQITIFDQFHERLHSGLEAYLAMTSAIGRTVQGSVAKGELEGVAGLERLCRIFGSAEYLEKKMQDWSDDVFFLELWSDLQERVKENSRTGRLVAGPMTISDVAARTSSTVADSNNGHDDVADGALFDETASAYRRLRMRSESVIVSSLVSSATTALRPYLRVSTWTSLSPTGSNNPITPSMDLAAAIRTLSTELSFLARVLALAPLRRITRQLLLSIQTYLWDNILMRNTFSTNGVTQLIHDVESICVVIDAAMSSTGSGASSSIRGEAARVMRKLKEGLLLLGLRVKADGGASSIQESTDEAGPDTGEGPVATPALGLWEAEKRVFANNESARSVLAELRIEMLSEAEARAVLERRVELRS
ncbi:hypothetical protein AJ80_04317 [Polytolypa hystricis UAMH7299]|uniref:RINT-1 family protein n=1 Tax=Polytolypa hystricis (strain UAMH7299) TaxID=1447883 RepID=A0A2B7YCT5_POLH7|nr:hypothetical protein AJ80_04317 [Polytolypa hystricis UAMH7299]